MGTKIGTRDTLVLAKQEGPTRVEVPPRGSSVKCLAGHCCQRKSSASSGEGGEPASAPTLHSQSPGRHL